MSFLDRLFGLQKKQRTMYDEFLESATPLLVNSYRRIAAERGFPLGLNISDAEIVEIYQKAGTAFQSAARVRGEFLPATIQNNIALIFLKKYQMVGQGDPNFFAEHIAYEAKRYQDHGLRDEYKEELSLFDEQPLWHRQIPQELQFRSPDIVRRLEALRQDVGLDHELFFMALIQSKNMVRRSVHSAYLMAKRSIPDCSERYYLTITIADRAARKMEALPYNSSPSAWTADQLQRLIEQAESLAETSKDIYGVMELAVQIEEDEGNFDDALGVINRIDEVLSDYAKVEKNSGRNA